MRWPRTPITALVHQPATTSDASVAAYLLGADRVVNTDTTDLDALLTRLSAIILAPKTSQLSARRQQTLYLLHTGYARAELPAILGISEDTVASHIQDLHRTYATSTLAHLLTRAWLAGDITTTPPPAEPQPGHPTLTRRQIDVLSCLAAGASKQTAADCRGIHPYTVRQHLRAAAAYFHIPAGTLTANTVHRAHAYGLIDPTHLCATSMDNAVAAP